MLRVPVSLYPALRLRSAERAARPRRGMEPQSNRVWHGAQRTMAEGAIQRPEEGDFDLDLFFFGTDAASAHSQVPPALHREADFCAENVQTGRGDAANTLSDGSVMSSGHAGLASSPIMNADLSSCFPRDSEWGVCNSNDLPGAPSTNSLDKSGQGDHSPSDITSIIAHLRSLATETSNECSRPEVEKPEPRSSGDATRSSESLTNDVSSAATAATVSRDRADNQVGFPGGLIRDVIANQHLFANVDSNFKRKSSAKIYVCAECGKTSPCHSAYIRHQRIHTGEKPYVCTDCGKSFIQISDYNNHVRSHTGEKPYTCAECGKSFSRSTYLVTHSRTHTKEKPYSCKVCGKSFVQHSHLSLHVRIHSGEKPYICIECGNSFSRSSTLVKHKKSHRRKTLHIYKKKNEDDITCNFTHNNPPTWGANTDPEQLDLSPSAAEPLKVKAETEEVLKCYPQALTYRKRHRGGKKTVHKPTRVMLQKYLINQGGTEKNPKSLPHSKKIIRKKKSPQPRSRSDPEPSKGISSPKREAHGPPAEDKVTPEGRGWSPEQGAGKDSDPDCTEEDYKIPKCELTGPACTFLNTHLEESSYDSVFDPSEEKSHKGSPFICSYCGKSCPCKSAFLRHQRIHTGEKPYSCPECGKSFIQASDYNNHVRSHTGEKPYKCSWCGKRFSRSTYLVTHSRTHTKEKPYTCNECGKSFIQHSHLAIHLRIHSGEKPYSCHECGKRFSRSSTLVKHQKSHYKNNMATEQPRAVRNNKSLGSSEPSSGGSS